MTDAFSLSELNQFIRGKNTSNNDKINSSEKRKTKLKLFWLKECLECNKKQTRMCVHKVVFVGTDKGLRYQI